MENKNVLNEEELAQAAGGYANMPNPFAPRETVTINPQVYSGAGHTFGDAWIAADGSMMYMVKPGDSLCKIATSYSLALNEVERLNAHIVNFKWIHPGDVIMLKRG